MQQRSNQQVSVECAETTACTFCTTSDVNSDDRVADIRVDRTLPNKAQQPQLSALNGLARGSSTVSVDTVSASIAHELSQPLAAIVMSVETCLRSLHKDPPDIAAGIAASERAVSAGIRAGRIIQCVRDLLARSRQGSELVNILELVRSAIAMCKPEFDKVGATLTVDFASTVRPIVSDSVALEQVLINLITNALHAIAETSLPWRHVHICVDAQDDDHVRLVVRDSGPGISSVAMQRLFDPFFTTKEAGIGLGLTISRMAVEACGGKLIARNHPEGGALFECVLPQTQRRTNERTRSIGSAVVSASRVSQRSSASKRSLNARQS